jgi:hypothetical protein
MTESTIVAGPRTASGLIGLIALHHGLNGQLGRFACEHPDRHDYLIAAEVQHAPGGPDLTEALAEVMERVRLHLCSYDYNPYGDDRADGHEPRQGHVASVVHKVVSDYIPRSLRGAVTCWSIRIYPEGRGLDNPEHARAQRHPKPGYDEELPSFPYHLPGHGEALAMLGSWDKHIKDREVRRAADHVRCLERLDQWRQEGSPPLWTEALNLAEAGLQLHMALPWGSYTYTEMPETVAALALALYLAAVEADTSPAEVRIDEQIVPHQTHGHDVTGWAERISAAGHDLADGSDPVVACWDMLRYDYCEPDASVDPIAAKMYDEDSTALSGTQLNLGLQAALRNWAGLWPDGVVTATSTNGSQAVRA